MCVCVCERERDGEREKERQTEKESEWVREGETDREKSDRYSQNTHVTFPARIISYSLIKCIPCRKCDLCIFFFPNKKFPTNFFKFKHKRISNTSSSRIVKCKGYRADLWESGIWEILRHQLPAKCTWFIHICIHIIYVYIWCICICIYIYIFMYMYIYMCICICIPVYICTKLYIYIYMHIYIHIYKSIYIHIYIYVYVYIYIFFIKRLVRWLYISNNFISKITRDQKIHTCTYTYIYIYIYIYVYIYKYMHIFYKTTTALTLHIK